MSQKTYFSPAFIRQVSIRMKEGANMNIYTQSKIPYKKRSYQEIREALMKASKMLEVNSKVECADHEQ